MMWGMYLDELGQLMGTKSANIRGYEWQIANNVSFYFF